MFYSMLKECALEEGVKSLPCAELLFDVICEIYCSLLYMMRTWNTARCWRPLLSSCKDHIGTLIVYMLRESLLRESQSGSGEFKLSPAVVAFS